MEIKAKLAIAEKGDFSVVEKASGESEINPYEQRRTAQDDRRRKPIFSWLNASIRRFATGCNGAGRCIRSGSRFARLQVFSASALLKRRLGDDAAARTAFLKAKNIFEEQLKQKPDDADLHVQFAKLLAWLGEKDAAIAEAQRAMDLRPESKDAFEGPEITEQVAQVYTILGDNARAIELLDGLLSRPSEVTLQSLKVDPAWDPLRNDPAFQALFAKYAGKA